MKQRKPLQENAQSELNSTSKANTTSGRELVGDDAISNALKELNGLYQLSNLFEQSELSLDEIFKEAVKLLPPGWQYPEITTAKIVFDDKIYQSPNFSDVQWCQTASICIADDCPGYVSVCYHEEKPDEFEGPFLKEERDLINTIADHIARTVERKRTIDALRESEKLQRHLFDNAFDSIFISDPETPKFIDCNINAAERLGYTVGYTAGQEFKKQNLDPGQFVELTLKQVFKDKAEFFRTEYEKTFNSDECSTAKRSYSLAQKYTATGACKNVQDSFDRGPSTEC